MIGLETNTSVARGVLFFTINYEAGLRLTPLEGWEASFTYFRFDFDNQIVSVVEDGITKFRNLGEARHQGLETELKWYPAFL